MRNTFAPATAAATIALIALSGCSTKPAPAPEAKETKTPMNPKVTRQDYGKTADGQPVDLYTLTNANELVIDYQAKTDREIPVFIASPRS